LPGCTYKSEEDRKKVLGEFERELLQAFECVATSCEDKTSNKKSSQSNLPKTKPSVLQKRAAKLTVSEVKEPNPTKRQRTS
jgi:carbohydrate-binding DOMON domain-containing protein